MVIMWVSGDWLEVTRATPLMGFLCLGPGYKPPNEISRGTYLQDIYIHLCSTEASHMHSEHYG